MLIKTIKVIWSRVKCDQQIVVCVVHNDGTHNHPAALCSWAVLIYINIFLGLLLSSVLLHCSGWVINIWYFQYRRLTHLWKGCTLLSCSRLLCGSGSAFWWFQRASPWNWTPSLPKCELYLQLKQPSQSIKYNMLKCGIYSRWLWERTMALFEWKFCPISPWERGLCQSKSRFLNPQCSLVDSTVYVCTNDKSPE